MSSTGRGPGTSGSQAGGLEKAGLMRRGCEALAQRTTGSTDKVFDPKGAFMGLGANYLMSSCCYAYAISEALLLRGFSLCRDLMLPAEAFMGLGPNYWMSSCCYAYAISEALLLPGFSLCRDLMLPAWGLAGSTDESLDPKLGLTRQRHFGCFVAKINGAGTYNLRGA